MRVNHVSSLQLRGDGGLLHQLSHHPRGRHVYLDGLLLFWGEFFFPLICALIFMNAFWTVQILQPVRNWLIRSILSGTDIFLLVFPTFPGFPSPSADHFQKDRAVPAEQHPGGRLHHRHRLSVCVHQYCKWLLRDLSYSSRNLQAEAIKHDKKWRPLSCPCAVHVQQLRPAGLHHAGTEHQPRERDHLSRSPAQLQPGRTRLRRQRLHLQLP